MKISILGTGNVGQALAAGLIKGDHQICFGSRSFSPEKKQELQEKIGETVELLSNSDAVQQGEVIILAVPYPKVEEILKSVPSLEGKILIDCTNPLKPDLSGLLIGHTTSAAEEIAKLAKGAKVVKSLNTTGAENMVNPLLGTERLSMLICGDDLEAKQTVADLVKDLGFTPIDTGPLYHARYLEPLAMLWIDMAIIQRRGRQFGFKLING